MIDPAGALGLVSALGTVFSGVVGDGTARVIGMALLGAAAAAALAAVYRGLLDERAPPIYPLLVGLGVVGVWLNTASALVAVIGEEPMVLEQATTNALALLAGGLGSVVGAQIGDATAPNVLALTGRRDLDREVSRVVKTVGRFTTVRLPSRIDDIEGDEPVLPEKKEALAGRELVFPRGLTVAQLRRRLIDRLKRDYGIGHVDVEVTEAGEVTHLALGRRAAGVGATLPPRTAAIAIEADPGFDASPDDRVQIWERGEAGYQRVATGDVRAVDGDDVTLALPTSQARKLDQTASHRLVTLPTGSRPDREFAALLRAGNETMAAVEIGAGSVLDGAPVGALRPTVIALRAGGSITTIPHPDQVLHAGEILFVIGRRDELRRVREAAGE